MQYLNPEDATNQAIEIVKAICSNPTTKIFPSEDAVAGIANFIMTLADELSGETSPQQ